MDYHFFVKDTPKNKQGSVTFQQLISILKKFLPVFLLSLLLPFFVALTKQTSPLGFMTRADRQEEFRVWLEPSTVVTERGVPVELAVVGQFDSDSSLIPTVNLTVRAEASLSPQESKLSYKTPFKGQAILGTVTVTPTQAGTYTVNISPSDVLVVAYDEPLTIVTSSTTLVVR